MRKNRVGQWGCGLALAAGTVIVPGAAAQGFTPISQSRSVDVSAEAVNGPIDDKHSNQQSAPDFNPFNGSVATSATAGDPVVGSQAIATASQVSSFTGDQFNISGSVEANSSVGIGQSAFASAESSADVTFTVAKEVVINLVENVDISPDLSNPGSNVATLSVSNGNSMIFGPVIVNDAFTASTPLTLMPGTYTFSFDAKAVSGDETDNAFNYAISMLRSSNNISVVPLPRAADAGLSLLAGLGLLRVIQRLRSRRSAPARVRNN